MRAWPVIFAMIAGMAAAAPDTSLRPALRPDGAPALQPSGTIVAPRRDPSAAQSMRSQQGPASSLRPELRPRKFERLARQQEKLRARGAVCADPDIKGEPLGRVPGRISGCGVENAVRVRSVSGIALSQEAVVDCKTAKALKTWLEETAKPALANSGGGLQRLKVAAHYICRTRNNQPGGRISEHGKGRAIDISALQMRDGSVITVREGWNDARSGKILRRMHRGACGPFGTVLGPDSDRFHRDHFHFDTARYRSGPFCR